MTDRDLGLPMNRKVDVYLEFRNDRQLGLMCRCRPGAHSCAPQSMRGRQSRVHRRGPDRPHAEGRDGARRRLPAFDVVGERRQVDFAVDTKARWMEEEIEVKLRAITRTSRST